VCAVLSAIEQQGHRAAIVSRKRFGTPVQRQRRSISLRAWVAATSHSDVSLSDHSAPFLPLGPLRRRGDL